MHFQKNSENHEIAECLLSGHHRQNKWRRSTPGGWWASRVFADAPAKKALANTEKGKWSQESNLSVMESIVLVTRQDRVFQDKSEIRGSLNPAKPFEGWRDQTWGQIERRTDGWQNLTGPQCIFHLHKNRNLQVTQYFWLWQSTPLRQKLSLPGYLQSILSQKWNQIRPTVAKTPG